MGLIGSMLGLGSWPTETDNFGPELASSRSKCTTSGREEETDGELSRIGASDDGGGLTATLLVTILCVLSVATRAGAAIMVGTGLNNGVGRMTSVEGVTSGSRVGTGDGGRVATGDGRGVTDGNRVVAGQTIGVQSLLVPDLRLLSNEDPVEGMPVCEGVNRVGSSSNSELSRILARESICG